jgi:hydroxymethylglutaryl-CoA lyase
MSSSSSSLVSNALDFRTLAGRRLYINDVAMRDGLQIEPVFVPTEDKVAMVNALSRTGLAKIEVTSFTSPKAIPALRDAEAVMKQIDRVAGVTYVALVPNLRGAERALECAVDEINLVMSVSETHNLANLRMTRQQSRDVLGAIIRQVGKAAAINISLSTAFGCPMEGEVPMEEVLKLGDWFHELGVAGMTLCDTTGMAHPVQVAAMCEGLSQRWRGTSLTLHFHNTRAMGLPNVLAGLASGIDRYDASLGGLGGCPYAPGATGNVCTEDLVHMLEQMGCDTGVDLASLLACAARLPALVQHEVPGQVLKAGASNRLHAPPAGFAETRERALARDLPHNN